MKILFTVLTCNRLYYLRNCVSSVLEFVNMDDNTQFMIVDNHTIEKGSDEYFSSLPESIIIHRFRNRVPNELYRAMNYAIQYCLDNGIAIVNFIQDDYQFVYSLDSMLPTVRKCFKKHPRVGQINYNMVWKRKKKDKWPTVSVNGTNFSILNNKNLVDNGFTRVKIYKKIGLYPQKTVSYDQNSEKTYGFDKNRYKNKLNGELWFGSQCRKHKYVRALSLCPNQTMMYDCAYVRKKLRFGKYFPPPHEYYFKPFDEEKIKQIATNNRKKKFSLIEIMAEPWGWVPTTFGKHNMQRVKAELTNE